MGEGKRLRIREGDEWNSGALEAQAVSQTAKSHSPTYTQMLKIMSERVGRDFSPMSYHCFNCEATERLSYAKIGADGGTYCGRCGKRVRNLR